ncbi:MAG TPA: alpha/beta fold hydrolase, partial [Candidatus Eisenbacteria bacterium]
MPHHRPWFRWLFPACCVAALIAPAAARAGDDPTPLPGDFWNPVAPIAGPVHVMPGIGHAHLDLTTRSSEVQKLFDQGLELLLVGWPAEADHAFSQAAALDSTCAMAQWGIAMSWLSGARRDSAIARAQALAPRASARERRYIEALASLKGAPEDRPPAAFMGAPDDYVRAMRRIVGAYPEDPVAKLLLAQGLIAGYETDGTPQAGTITAIALLEGVIHKDVSNAAAHHMLAHAYLQGPSPEQGADEAEQFAKSAPAVAHAAYLSGWVALRAERPDDAARAFETAARQDEGYMRAMGEVSAHASGPYGRILFTLATVYAEQGRYDDAVRVASRMLERARRPGEAGGRIGLSGRLAMIRALVRAERWNQILDPRTFPDDGGFEVLKPWRHYALGRAWLGRGDPDRAWAELIALDQDVTRLKRELPKDVPQRLLQARQLPALTLAPLVLKGRILAREGMGDEALATLRRSAEVQRRNPAPEPWLYLCPVEEAIGDVALELRRWSDAIAAYQAALDREPGDGRALLGLARACEGAGKKAEATQARAQLAKLWARADRLPAASPGGVSPPGVAPAGSVATAASDPVPVGPAPPRPAASAPSPPVTAPSARPVPPASDPFAGRLKKARVNGVQLAYVEIGRGDPVVLVHGALADYREWAPQIGALAKHHRVVAYSRRYHYPNAPANEHADYSYAVNEEDLVALIKALRLGPVHLIGHGYGGVVAMLAARDHPEMVRSLVLAEPGLYSMIPRKKDRRAALDGLKVAAASSGDAVRAGDLERAVRQFYDPFRGGHAPFDSLPESSRRMMEENARTLLLGAEPPPTFSCE